MHQIIIDASSLDQTEWRNVCQQLEAQAYNYHSSTSQNKKIYIECASVSQMADIVEFIREISDLN